MAQFVDPTIEKDAEDKRKAFTTVKLLNSLRDLITTFEEIKKDRRAAAIESSRLNLTDELPEDIEVDERIKFTIGEFWEFITVIELSPIQYQRFFRADLSWQQQFMNSFFIKKVIIPEIALRFGQHIPKGEVEVMDGCQRMSAVVLFKKGDLYLPYAPELEFVKLPGLDFEVDLREKNWQQLPQSVRDYIDNYKLQAQVYYKLDPAAAGHIFVDILNNQNTLVHQEKRQAISSSM